MPTLQMLTQVMVDPCQGPLLKELLVKGTQGERQSGLWMDFTTRSSPDPIAPVVLHHEGELFALELIQPERPALIEMAPLAGIQILHRGVQVVAGELCRQGWTDPLIGLLKGLAQEDRDEREPLLPAFKALRWIRCQPLQHRWWAVGITGGERAHAGLMVPDLTTQGNDAALLIEEQQVAVPSHQLQHEHPLDRFPRAFGKPEFHHTFKADLVKLHKSQLAEAVLQLLREGAAAAAARGRVDLHQPRCVGLPAQFQPHPPPEAAASKLNRGWVGLLGLFEAAGHQPWTQIPEHRAKRGEIHWLQAGGSVHLEHRAGQWGFLLC